MYVVCLGSFVVVFWLLVSLCVDVIVKLSAYDIMLMLMGVEGI